MKSILLSLAVGIVFGVGLLLSGMTQPAKVVNFLDVLGDWDPSLGFVMGGAIAVHFLAYRLVPRLAKPAWAERWALPTRRDIDIRLLVGAVLFGAGWGLGGYCPGPALTSVVAGASSTLIFTGSMLAGMWGFSVWEAARVAR
ncbi:MAG: YeeE/YedE family protein [Pseudomonadota bacterium]|nr:YeeE/YedE family protein [Pseudomonadota bacterium]